MTGPGLQHVAHSGECVILRVILQYIIKFIAKVILPDTPCNNIYIVISRMKINKTSVKIIASVLNLLLKLAIEGHMQ